MAELLAGFSIPVTVFQPGAEAGEDRDAERGSLVSVVRGKEVLRIDGHFGRFRIRIRTEEGGVTACEAGFVLIAGENASTGPRGMGIPLPDENVLGVEELEALASAEESEGDPDALGVWLDPLEGWPDRATAQRVLRALLRLKANGRPECYVLARHVPLWGMEGQSLYDALREKGVRFLRPGAGRPELKAAEGKVEIEVQDQTITGETVRLRLDRILFVGQPSPPGGAEEVARCTGDSLDREGFLQKDNVHLYPSRSFRRGIYYLGSCKGEQAGEELAEEVASILPEILGPMAAGEVQAPEGIRIDKGHCVSCLTCYRVCPHRALDIGHGPVPVPVDPACYGCGLCAALCPGNAIELVQRPGSKILRELEGAEALEAGSSPTVLFCCSRSGLGSSSRDGGPCEGGVSGARTIEVPCACTVSEEMLLAALREGAERVVVVGCHPDNCVSQKGPAVGEKRARRVAGYLAAAEGGAGAPVRFVAVAPNETHRGTHILQRLDQDDSGPGAGSVVASSEGEDR